jgi:hypothetical protein
MSDFTCSGLAFPFPVLRRLTPQRQFSPLRTADRLETISRDRRAVQADTAGAIDRLLVNLGEWSSAMQRNALSVIKRSVLFFWAAWLSVVVTTNVLEGMQALGMLSDSFKFVSGNWRWINQVMDPIGVPRGLQEVMFIGAISWEALAATLFWLALATYRDRPLVQERVTLYACGANLALWGAFQVLDEVFMAYPPEAVHRVIFGNQIATLLLLHFLTDATKQSGSSKTDE